MTVPKNQKYYFFYDLETSGLKHRFDQIFQFSAIIISETDFIIKSFKAIEEIVKNWDQPPHYKKESLLKKKEISFGKNKSQKIEIEYINFYIKLNDDIIPSPGSLIKNRLCESSIEDYDLLTDFEAALVLHKFFHSNHENIILVGHNIKKYDNQLLASLFYRNLFDPNILEQCHSIVDTYPTAVLYSYLKNDTFSIWPKLDGKEIFQLEYLKKSLALDNIQSHNGLNDVLVTFALAKKFQEHGGDLWRNLVEIFSTLSNKEKYHQNIDKMRSLDGYASLLAIGHPSIKKDIIDIIESDTASYKKAMTEVLPKGLERILELL